MGIKNCAEMPDYEKVRVDIDNFMSANSETSPETNNA